MASINGLKITIVDIYHDWFRDEDRGVDSKANPAEIARIVSGKDPLPNGAIVQYDVEPLSDSPLDLDNGDTIPDVVLAVTSVNENKTDTFTVNGPFEGEFSKVKPGRFQKSRGYAGLVVIQFPDHTGPRVLKVTASGNEFESSLDFPWVATGVPKK